MSDLINTLESPGEFNALTNLRPDEPYFLLVGRDRLAPRMDQKWADDNRDRALKEFAEGKIDEEKRDRELRKSTQAESIGWSMQAYKAGHEAKRISEARPTERESYSGVKLPEETRRRDLIQSARVRSHAAVKNAMAELVELFELTGEPSTTLDNPTINALYQLADQVAPPSRAEILERANG